MKQIEVMYTFVLKYISNLDLNSYNDTKRLLCHNFTIVKSWVSTVKMLKLSLLFMEDPFFLSRPLLSTPDIPFQCRRCKVFLSHGETHHTR
jgi:hypothetical protein